MKTASIITLSMLLLAACTTTATDEKAAETMAPEAIIAPQPDDVCTIPDPDEVCAIRDPDDCTCVCKKVNAAGQCEEGGGTIIIQGSGQDNIADTQ